MANVISVITAAHPPTIPYLADAYASLVAQELPAGWTWEWIVQEDGDTGEIAAALPDDPRIRPGMSRRSGPAVTRTMALARSQGSLIKNLDGDDQLLAGALARDIDVLAHRAEIGWTTARVLDLLPDGSVISWEHTDPQGGVLHRGSVLESYRRNDWLLPVHPATLCIRRELILALGGWMALATSEDTGLLLAVDAIADGYFIHAPGLLYRKHPGQVTAQPYHVQPTERAARQEFIAARAQALAALLHPEPRITRTTQQVRRIS